MLLVVTPPWTLRLQRWQIDLVVLLKRLMSLLSLVGRLLV